MYELIWWTLYAMRDLDGCMAHASFVFFMLIQLISYLVLWYSIQHELSQAADEGVRALIEQSDGDTTPLQRTMAMKAAVKKRHEALYQKMGKYLAVANPNLTDGWLHEVCYLTHISGGRISVNYPTSQYSNSIQFLIFNYLNICRLRGTSHSILRHQSSILRNYRLLLQLKHLLASRSSG